MSTATLNVWITEKGDPCRITDKQLFVYVLRCNGEVLEWCDKKYVGLPTKCGHLEIPIPVGCYIVGAVENPNGLPPLGNHLTHIAPIRANCGDHVCVTLFNPTFHHCRHWFAQAIRDHLQAEALPREAATVARQALEAVDRLAQVLPDDAFTVTQAKALEERPKAKKK